MKAIIFSILLSGCAAVCNIPDAVAAYQNTYINPDPIPLPYLLILYQKFIYYSSDDPIEINFLQQRQQQPTYQQQPH